MLLWLLRLLLLLLLLCLLWLAKPVQALRQPVPLGLQPTVGQQKEDESMETTSIDLDPTFFVSPCPFHWSTEIVHLHTCS